MDVIISGQAFEHIEFFLLTWLGMVRVLKPRGLVFLIAPSRGPEHRFAVDCWRFYPDGYRALAKYGGLELVEVSTDLSQARTQTATGEPPWECSVSLGFLYSHAIALYTVLNLAKANLCVEVGKRVCRVESSGRRDNATTS